MGQLSEKNKKYLKRNTSYLSIPMRYSVEPSDDDRILKLKMYVMHDGKNPNKSNFSLSTIEDAEETIKNIPILAYIDYNNPDGKDFTEHEMELIEEEDENGEKIEKIKFLEQPVGSVPETNDYHYEIIDGRNYVVVTANIWKKYCQDAVDILEANDETKVSMEISIEDFKYDRKTKILDILKYKYTAITLLGRKVESGMIDAHAEVNFSFKESDDYYSQVEKLTANFKSHFEDLNIINGKKESETMPKNKKEIASLFSLTFEQLENELRKVLRTVVYICHDDWCGDYECRKYWLQDFDENFLYAYNCEKDIYEKLSYSKQGDDVVIDFENPTRVRTQFVDWQGASDVENSEDGMMDDSMEHMDEMNMSLKEAYKSKSAQLVSEKETSLNDLQDKFTKVNEEITNKENTIIALNEKYSTLEGTIAEKDSVIESITNEVNTFRAKERKEKVEGIFSKYAKHMTKEEMDSFREKELSFSKFEDFEKEIKSFVCDKIADTVNQTLTFSRMAIIDDDTNNKENAESTSVWDRLSKNK